MCTGLRRSGCGKTTYLSSQTKRAAEKYGPTHVAVASLTRAAAEEVAGRDTGIPQQNIATLHAHAYRALDNPKIADVPRGFVDWNAHIGEGPLQIRRELSSDLDAPPMEAFGYASDGEILLAEYGIERNRMTDRSTWRPKLLDFAERWEEWKRESGRLDFTDLIEGALERAERLPGEIDVFMLDEAQDLSRLEMALARKWGERTEHFVVVGDPQQNLFSFRGSDADVFSGIDAESTHVLSQSYRVPRAVHAYATKWVEKLGQDPVEYKPRDEEGEVRLAKHPWTRPDAIVKEVIAELEADRSVMLLASCGFMLQPLIRSLKAHGVPYHNPYRPTMRAWNPLGSSYRVSAYLSPILKDEATQAAERAARALGAGIWTWGELEAWTEPLLAKGVLRHGAKSRIAEHCVKDRFGDSEAGLTPNREETEELFEEGQLEEAEKLDLAWWESKLRTKKKATYAYPLEVIKRHGPGALTKTPRAVVGTIHSTKGAESDAVWVWPDISRRAAQEIQRKGPGRDAAVRLYYVAFTRARQKLTICRPDAQWYLQLPDP